jgi:flagellar basal-body rod modification protein FlgD
MADPVGTVTPPPIGTVGTNYGFSVGLPASKSSGVDTKGDKDMFLKLLVAQMKYQDPTKPTDASAFLAQTAQFTLVEKMDALESSQAEMLATNHIQAATALVGNTVSWNDIKEKDADGKPIVHTGPVDGVTITNGIPTLLIGSDEIALSEVTKVTKTPVPTPPKVPPTA